MLSNVWDNGTKTVDAASEIGASSDHAWRHGIFLWWQVDFKLPFEQGFWGTTGCHMAGAKRLSKWSKGPKGPLGPERSDFFDGPKGLKGPSGPERSDFVKGLSP